MSHASEEITPLKTDVRGKIVPFFDRDNDQTEVRDVKHWLIMLKNLFGESLLHVTFNFWTI